MIRFYPHQLFRQEQRPQGRPIQAGCRFRSTARAGATLPLITISEAWLCRPNGLFEVKASRLTNPERLHISIAYRVNHTRLHLRIGQRQEEFCSGEDLDPNAVGLFQPVSAPTGLALK